jgi:hypothetical protein
MVFVRYKTVKGRRYYQLARNFRENGAHRQEVICHLGPHRSIDAAIEAEQRKIAADLESYESRASYWREQLARLEEDVLQGRVWGDIAYARRSHEEAVVAHEELAATRRARLDKLLEVRQKYF